MITAYQALPLLALANQWFAFTKYMTDMRWAPLLGASVISTRAWARVPVELQPKLLQAAREAGRALDKKVRAQEQQAINAMVKRGLKLVPISPEVLKEWEKFTLAVYPEIRGKVVPAKYFDEALRLRDEYRATHAMAGKTR
jgi:TRAP-type C4-dicarboxylate transport system substrate-binding protein